MIVLQTRIEPSLSKTILVDQSQHNRGRYGLQTPFRSVTLLLSQLPVPATSSGARLNFAFSVSNGYTLYDSHIRWS